MQPIKLITLKVAVFARLDLQYSYLPPSGLGNAEADHVQRKLPRKLPEDGEWIGRRVLVPLGARQVVGVVVALESTDCEQLSDGTFVLNLSPTQDKCEGGKIEASAGGCCSLKEIAQILDDSAIFSASDLRLAEWISKFYLHPLGDTLMQTLPAKLRKAKTLLRNSDTAITINHNPPNKNSNNALNNNTNQDSSLEFTVQLPDFQLSPAQTQVLTQLYEHLNSYACYLLYGHTNSGKTEIYLRLTEQVLRMHRQVLILVPEISLTPQTIKRFQQRFPTIELVIYHSQMTDKQRLDAWKKCFNGIASIVIGTRSAVFLPLNRLGVIILDEEHDASFKQESQLRYSARDVAIIKAKLRNLPVLLGSATPSIESWYNAQRKRFCLLVLPPRTAIAASDNQNKITIPETKVGSNDQANICQNSKFNSKYDAHTNDILQIIDASKERTLKGFSMPVLRAIEDCLANNQQVLIFLNRRGFAATITCQHCGWSAECPHCDSSMTVHKGFRRLVCHHCEHSVPLFEKCPKCHSTQLKIKGLGTEGLEEAITEIFPGYPIARIDRDTTSRKGVLAQLLEGINRLDYRILIGTQILAKGHHFPKVTLVVIMNVDAGLFSGDFHSEEQLAQLVVQVMGRAGRGELPGRVMLQTNYPNHPFFSELKMQDYAIFLQRCLQERQEIGLPPFSCHAVLQAEAKQRAAAWQFLQQIAELAKEDLGEYLQVWGPAALAMERRADYFRAQLVFQADDYAKLHSALRRIDNYIRSQSQNGRRGKIKDLSQSDGEKSGGSAFCKNINKIKWFWDINPLNLLSA